MDNMGNDEEKQDDESAGSDTENIPALIDEDLSEDDHINLSDYDSASDDECLSRFLFNHAGTHPRDESPESNTNIFGEAVSTEAQVEVNNRTITERIKYWCSWKPVTERAHGMPFSELQHNLKKVSEEETGAEEPIPKEPMEREKLGIHSINLTSLAKHGNSLAAFRGHIAFMQEHCAPKSILKQWTGIVRQVGWKMLAGPCDSAVKGSGVGCLTRDPPPPL